MKKLLAYIAAALCLTVSARAAPLPDALHEALPAPLLEAAEDGNVLADGVSWLWATAAESLNGLLRAGARSAALLTLASILCGAADSALTDAGGGAARFVPYCGVLTIGALATGDLRSLIGLGAQTVEELVTLSRLLLPTLAASMAASGLVTTASVWQVTTLMACDAFGSAVSGVLLPLVYCLIAAAAAGAAMGESRLDTLADGLKKLISGALKLVMTAFTAYLAAAGVLTGSADRTAVKAAKLAVSGFVPVVGGVLSDAAESVLSAAGTLRGTVGAASIFAILAACLTPLLRLGVQFLLYKLAAFAAGLAGTEALGRFLDRLGDAFALVFAMTASCALMLLVALIVATTVATG